LLRGGASWLEHFVVSHTEGSARNPAKKGKSTVYPWLTIQDTTGFDLSMSQSEIIIEIQELITNLHTIHGVIFVVEVGRSDDWDKAVFMFYLQFILSGVPSSMVGVVFTRAHEDCVLTNDWQVYHQQKAPTEDGYEPFINALLARCENKLCFIDNPAPSKDAITDKTKVRQKSLDNVIDLISKFQGKFAFEGILDTLENAFKYYLKYAQENPLRVAAAGISVGISIAGAILKLKK